jgi:hypothetical protein
MSGVASLTLRTRNAATWVELCQIALSDARFFGARTGSLIGGFVVSPAVLPRVPVSEHLKAGSALGNSSSEDDEGHRRVVPLIFLGAGNF